MPKTRPPYAPEFRQQMVELVRAGRSAEERWLMSAVGQLETFPALSRMSAVGGRPDEISTKADIGPQRSVRRPAGQRLARLLVAMPSV